MWDGILFGLTLATLAVFIIRSRIIFWPVLFCVFVLAAGDCLTWDILSKPIDYLTLANLDYTMLSKSFTVIPQTLFVCFLFFVFGLWLFSCWHNCVYVKGSRFFPLGFFVLVLLVNWQTYYYGTWEAYWELAKSAVRVYSYKDCSFQDILQKLHCQKQYVSLADAKCSVKDPQNLIVIYCESFDKNFLDENLFPYETAHLRDLIHSSYRLYGGYNAVEGSTATISALYATETGLPTFFETTDHNRIFMSLKSFFVPSYAGVLKKCGYKNIFLTNCEAEFGGTGALMRMLGYEDVEGAETYSYRSTNWGVHDREVFASAKKKYLELTQGDRPFNITLLTVDTHFPKGLPDADMGQYVDSHVEYLSHEYTVATLDYLLWDFVQWLKLQPGAEKTAVVILGDHNMMGSEESTKVKKKLHSIPEQAVLLMSNRSFPGKETSSALAFYDMPGIMLSLCGVTTDATFPKDLWPKLSAKDISDNKELFTVLNMKLTE